jgi:uridine kinase
MALIRMALIEESKRSIIAAIRSLENKDRTPIIVALDGPSGAGKSTLASLVADDIRVALVRSDDFYAADVPDVQWDLMSPEAKADRGINWRRLRTQALEPLLDGRRAEWQSFDFEHRHADGTYPLQKEPTRCGPASVVILDGAYSGRPELDDLIALKVLVQTPPEVRNARLAGREEPSFLVAWHQRWDAAEAYYFTKLCPCSSFDLVVPG